MATSQKSNDGILNKIDYLMNETIFGPLSDLSESLFTVFLFLPSFEAIVIFGVFMLLDIIRVISDNWMSSILGSTSFGSIIIEWVQFLLYCYFCGWTPASIVFMGFMASLQTVGHWMAKVLF